MLTGKDIPQQASEKEKQERRQGKGSRQKSKNQELMKIFPPPLTPSSTRNSKPPQAGPCPLTVSSPWRSPFLLQFTNGLYISIHGPADTRT